MKTILFFIVAAVPLYAACGVLVDKREARDIPPPSPAERLRLDDYQQKMFDKGIHGAHITLPDGVSGTLSLDDNANWQLDDTGQGEIPVIPSIDTDGKVFARRVESHRQEKE